jgi:hypothetical protein
LGEDVDDEIVGQRRHPLDPGDIVGDRIGRSLFLPTLAPTMPARGRAASRAA